MFSIYKRELTSYFHSLMAYVVVVIFLLVALGFAFFFGRFLDADDADLAASFFVWHPWIYIILVPAVGMRLWADENHYGTKELLATMPISLGKIIIAKFLAAATLWALALGLSAALWLSANYLGEPDNGKIFAGYVGSFLLCLTILAISNVFSAMTSSQIICFVLATLTALILNLISFDGVLVFLRDYFAATTVDKIAGFGFLQHYAEFTKGILSFSATCYFLSICIVCLMASFYLLSGKK